MIPDIEIIQPTKNQAIQFGQPVLLEFWVPAGGPAVVNVVVFDEYDEHILIARAPRIITLPPYTSAPLHDGDYAAGAKYAVALDELPILGFHRLWIHASDKANPSDVQDKRVPLRIVP